MPCFFYFCILNIEIMGRGDKRTKRGKISKGSFGKTRIARRTAKKKTATAAKA